MQRLAAAPPAHPTFPQICAGTRIATQREDVARQLQIGISTRDTKIVGAAIARHLANRASIFRKGWRLPIYISAILRYLIAIVGHELAHILMATALSVRIKRIGLSWAGPYIVRDTGSLKQNLAITMSGCAFNIGIAICLMHVWAAAALVNMVLGVYNLLPIPGSDGKRALALLK
jgi:Zn-dependent protease